MRPARVGGCVGGCVGRGGGGGGGGGRWECLGGRVGMGERGKWVRVSGSLCLRGSES